MRELVAETQPEHKGDRSASGACDCAYPGVEILPDGTILAVTYGKWDSSAPNYIMAVRFKLDDLLKSFQ